MHLEISPILEAPPDDESSLSNSALLGSKGVYEHDDLRFRSRTEIKVYEALKKRNVLFFAEEYGLQFFALIAKV